MRNAGLYIAGIVGGALIIGVIEWRTMHPEPQYGGHNAGYWVKQLDDPSAGGLLRMKAFAAVREMGSAAIPYLTVAPRPEDTRLKHLGESLYFSVASHFSRDMRKRLPFRPSGSGSMIVGSGCAAALGRMGPKARTAIPTLEKWLYDPDDNVCNSAFIALLQIAPDDEHVINALLQKLKTTTGFTREMLLGNPANVYDEISPRAVAVIPLLTYVLETGNVYARMRAAGALGRFGSAAEKLKPQLEAALQDSNVDVQIGAAIGLWRLDGRLEPTLGILNNALKSENTRWWGVTALAEIGPPAKDSLPLLIPLLEDTHADFRAAASNAVQRIERGKSNEFPRKPFAPD